MNREIDTFITDLVQSVEHQLPTGVEESLDRKLQKAAAAKKDSKYRWWYSPVLAAAVLIMVIFMHPLMRIHQTAGPPLNEIRTEFELKDKNIKIIWFQKKDFQLRRNNK
jgi:hypothetical protein